MKKEKLAELRDVIDKLDKQLIETLAERHKVVQQVISSKIETTKNIRDTDREAILLGKIRKMAAESGLDPYFAESLFRDVIFQSVRYQTHSLIDHQNDLSAAQTITVAYQGAEGAYSHQAALRFFGERYSDIKTIGHHSFEQAAEAVENDHADVAILPIENTTAGSINNTYDLLFEKNLHLIGEEILKISHCLLTLAPINTENIRRIVTHSLGITQCSRFLNSLSRCTIESYSDSAMAAAHIKKEGDLSQAAIASPYAAELYGLHIQQEQISNQEENYTRFVIVSKKPVTIDPQLPSKTSLVLATVDEKGALIRCLRILDELGINMTKLESRPHQGKPWQYLFYVDIEGNIADLNVQKALKEMDKKAAFLKVLGCYAKNAIQ